MKSPNGSALALTPRFRRASAFAYSTAKDGKCWISGRKIRPGDLWDLDHKVALINGGEHRESNLFPALRDKHREKTREDVAEKSKVARVRSKHVGIRKPSQFQSRGFEKRPPQRKASTPTTKWSLLK